MDLPAAPPRLPILSDVLGVRPPGGLEVRRLERWMAGLGANREVSAVQSWRFGSAVEGPGIRRRPSG